MVIGYDAKRAFCNNTGLGNYSRGVITQTIKQSDNQAILFTPSVKGRYEHFFENLEFGIVEPKGLWRVMKSVWRSVGVSRAVKRDGVELFHGLSHELPYGLPKGVKKVVTMHDLIVFRFPEFFKPADRLIHRLKMRHACRVADVVVAISEQTKRDLMEFLQVPEEKIRVVYQSCDSIFWGVQDDRDIRKKYGLPEKYIICVGTLEERKNQLSVVEAMKHLPEEISLLLIGRPRGEYGQRVLEKVKDESSKVKSDRFCVLTGADFKDFPALYRGAVASVYLSRFEGFGIPVLESMCCDCPVVTSDVSSMPEAGGDAALYASPEDVETVAEHLKRLCTDDSFRQQQIEKGRIQRKRFAPEKVAADMLEVYKSLL